MPTFSFYRFNRRRMMRGAEAVQVEVCDDETSYILWMSKKDLKNNIKLYGEREAFTRGLECYRTGKDPGEPVNANLPGKTN